MADNTNISWTRPPWVKRGATWNMIGGCTRHSPGCENCWAERDTARFAQNPSTPRFKGLATFRPDGEARWSREVRTWPDKLHEPLHWREPRGVFVCSKSDLFHEAVPNEFIAAVFRVMASCPQHTFFVPTKRSERMRQWFEWYFWHERRPAHRPSHRPMASGKESLDDILTTAAWKNGWPLPNVWLGVTIESQEYVVPRTLDLVQTPAALRWLSLEPLLGPVNLGLLDTLPKDVAQRYTLVAERIGWVVVGGESGSRARPFDLAWARSLRDQCSAAGTAFFTKQLGAHVIGPAGLDGGGRQGVRLTGYADRAGADPDEWPADLKVQQFPAQVRP